MKRVLVFRVLGFRVLVFRVLVFRVLGLSFPDTRSMLPDSTPALAFSLKLPVLNLDISCVSPVIVYLNYNVFPRVL